MSKVFSEEEMKVRCVIPGARGRIDMPVFSAPITAKENMKRAIYDKKSSVHAKLQILPEFYSQGSAGY